MNRRRSGRWFGLFLVGALVTVATAAHAAGPLYVGGPTHAEGVPFRWNPAAFPLTYWTDWGSLGNRTNAQADTLVTEAFQVWEAVPTARISFSAAGELGADVTATNIMVVLNALENCATLPGPPSGGIAQNRSIIYDVNGSLIEALGEDANSVLGFASPTCLSTNGIDENSFNRGVAVMNGKFIDGIDTASNPEVSLQEFRAVFIHEFGHMIGLDHTQINLNCFPFGLCGADDLEGLPTMFPYLLSLEMATLAPDDIAAVSVLYPEDSFATTTGRITGRIFFSDGQTHGQGFNVIARQVNDPGTPGVDESRRVAVSCVSGFLYTADAGNPLVQFPGFTPSPFGSRDQTLIGYYDLPGLPPGDYTVEIEAIEQEFVLGSGAGPIGNLGFQFPLPGPPEFWDAAESASDDPATSSPVIVTAGQTPPDANIILNGTPPRFDAWESD